MAKEGLTYDDLLSALAKKEFLPVYLLFGEEDFLIEEATDAIINEAKGKATSEANRLLQMAREAINNEKQAAITELKNQVATLSIEIAEKILREQLKDTAKQKELAEKYLKEVKLN